MSIASNIQEIRAGLPAQVNLIAVSKTKPVEAVMEAYHAGQRAFGENKVQEMISKYAELPKDIEWHLIGHLQSNKVKYIAPFVHLIHSVDTLKLLEVIHKEGIKAGRVIPCLLQVHIAEEETKFGLSEEELEALLNAVKGGNYAGVTVAGLMGMATNTNNRDQIRKEFRHLKSLYDNYATSYHFEYLSMGMSSDYDIAIEEGANLIRVGSTVFGSR